MGIPENIDALMVKYDIPASSIARAAGVSEATVSGWRKGAQPRRSNLKRLCDHFGLTEDDILSESAGLAAKEHGLYQPIPVAATSVATVPLKTLGRVHAGEVMEEEQIEREVEVPASVYEHHPHAFALLVEGGCMDRVIPDGSHVLVDPDREPSNGSIAVVEDEMHCAIMRRWYKGASNLMLVPDSFGEYDDIVLSEEDGPIKVLGTVVWYQSADEME
jgi:repressor LexA